MAESFWQMMGARVTGMVLRTGPTLAAIAAELPARTGFALRYGAILVVIPQIILVVLGIFGVGFTNVGFGTVFAVGLTGALAGSAMLLLTAAIARWVGGALDGEMDYGRALAFIIYATTPVWIFAAIGNLIDPIQRLVSLIGVIWAIVLIFVGSRPVLGIVDGKRGVFTFAVSIAMLLIWVILLSMVYGIMIALVGGELAGQFTTRR